MSRSLQINGLNWELTVLGELAILMKPGENFTLSDIHKTTRILEKAGLDGVIDIIAAYDSIALVYDHMPETVDKEMEIIESGIKGISVYEHSPNTHRIPVCYELGCDWNEVEKHTGLSRPEIIKRHTEPEYTVAMMGFIPGFLYLKGLDESISCPRKKEPRTKVPVGSVGIAGDQTGIYSLQSPGGWQIIGRTPESFFNINKEPPGLAEPGDYVKFYEIPKEDFEEYNSKRDAG